MPIHNFALRTSIINAAQCIENSSYAALGMRDALHQLKILDTGQIQNKLAEAAKLLQEASDELTGKLL